MKVGYLWFSLLGFSLLVFLAGCNQQQEPTPTSAPEPEGPEPVAVTRWSDRTELFIE